jgi:hypothetical protein
LRADRQTPHGLVDGGACDLAGVSGMGNASANASDERMSRVEPGQNRLTQVDGERKDGTDL